MPRPAAHLKIYAFTYLRLEEGSTIVQNKEENRKIFYLDQVLGKFVLSPSKAFSLCS